MPAPHQNRNAAKPAKSRAGALVQLRVRPADKAAWQRAARAWARAHGITASPLTAWIISRLNLAAAGPKLAPDSVTESVTPRPIATQPLAAQRSTKAAP